MEGHIVNCSLIQVLDPKTPDLTPVGSDIPDSQKVRVFGTVIPDPLV